jgi:hypothetical protein
MTVMQIRGEGGGGGREGRREGGREGEGGSWSFATNLAPQGADPPPPLPLRVVQANRNHLNEKITSSSPLG